jgi:hypothetical protein
MFLFQAGIPIPYGYKIDFAPITFLFDPIFPAERDEVDIGIRLDMQQACDNRTIEELFLRMRLVVSQFALHYKSGFLKGR